MKAEKFDQQFDEDVDLTASVDVSKARRVLQQHKRANERIYESEITRLLLPEEGIEIAEARRSLAIAQSRGLVALRIGFVTVLSAVILGNLVIQRSWPFYWPVAAMILIGITAIVVRYTYLVKESRAESLIRKLESIERL